MVIDLWSFRPNAVTRPIKAPVRSIHSSTEEHHCGFLQKVIHPNTNAANCCLTSIVVTLAFYNSAIGKRQNSSGDLSNLSCISQCILMLEITTFKMPGFPPPTVQQVKSTSAQPQPHLKRGAVYHKRRKSQNDFGA